MCTIKTMTADVHRQSPCTVAGTCREPVLTDKCKLQGTKSLRTLPKLTNLAYAEIHKIACNSDWDRPSASQLGRHKATGRPHLTGWGHTRKMRQASE